MIRGIPSMGTDINFKEKKYTLYYDIVPIGAGAIAGYCKAKGSDIGNGENVALFGPTVFASLTIYLGMKAARVLKKHVFPERTLEKMLSTIESDINPQQVERNLKENLSNKKITKATVGIGIKTAIETGLGYLLGYTTGSLL